MTFENLPVLLLILCTKSFLKNMTRIRRVQNINRNGDIGKEIDVEVKKGRKPENWIHINWWESARSNQTAGHTHTHTPPPPSSLTLSSLAHLLSSLYIFAKPVVDGCWGIHDEKQKIERGKDRTERKEIKKEKELAVERSTEGGVGVLCGQCTAGLISWDKRGVWGWALVCWKINTTNSSLLQ